MVRMAAGATAEDRAQRAAPALIVFCEGRFEGSRPTRRARVLKLSLLDWFESLRWQSELFPAMDQRIEAVAARA